MITQNTLRKYILPEMIERIGKISDGMLLQAKDRYGIFFSEKDSNQVLVEMHTDESSGEAVYWPEGSNIDEFEPKMGYSRKVHQLQFALGFSATKPIMKFDRMDLIQKAKTELGETPAETVNYLGLAMIQLGNGGTVPVVRGKALLDLKSIDGQNIFATGHTFKNNVGVTNANYITSISLDESGLNTFADIPLAWRDELSRPMKYKLMRLVVPRALRHSAAKFLKSEFQPETMNNAINTVREDLGPGDYQVCDELSSATAFYGITNVPKRRMPTLRWGWKPETETDKDINTLSTKVKMSFSVSFEHFNPYATIRSGA